jgi:hypothetical protein
MGRITPNAVYFLYWGAVGLATVYVSQEYLQQRDTKENGTSSIKWPSSFVLAKRHNIVANKDEVCKLAAEKYSSILNEVICIRSVIAEQ